MKQLQIQKVTKHVPRSGHSLKKSRVTYFFDQAAVITEAFLETVYVLR